MTASFVSLLNSNYFPGELSPFSINLFNIEITYWYVINVISLIFILLIYKYFSTFRFAFKYKVNVKYSKMNILMLIMLMVNLLFVIKTGVGVVGSSATSSLTPIILLFKPDTFFYAYFLLLRPEVKKFKMIFIINIVLFSVLKLSQGWSGFVFAFFFLELFYRFNNRSSLKNMHYIIIAPLVILLLGGALYSKVYVIKNEIRNTPVEEISVSDGVEHLANRLSYLPIAIGTIQNQSKILSLYKSDSQDLKEFKAIFRPLVPSFLFTNKDFRTLNNVVMQSYYPTISKGTSSNFGLPLYAYILYCISPMESFFYFGIVIIFIYFTKVFFDFVSTKPGQLDFLILMALFNLISIGSLEVVFSYGFFSNLTFLVIAIFFGAFTLSKRIT